MTVQRETIELLSYAGLGAAIALLPIILALVYPARQAAATESVGNRSWVVFMAAIVVALALSADLLLSDTYILNYVIVTPLRIALVVLVSIPISYMFLSSSSSRQPIICVVLFAIFAAIALILNFSSGPFDTDQTLSLRTQFFNSGWYHWGAYLASAKSVAAGLAI